MSRLGVKLSISCVIMSLFAACQLKPPSSLSENYSLPTVSPDLVQILDENRLVEVYDRIQPGVVSIRRYDQGRILFGSGFVVDERGHILTNWHVVSSEGSIEVAFSSGLLSEAKVIGSDESSDLAVLEAEVYPPGIYPLPLGAPSGLKIGQFVLAIGNPIGLQNTMSSGIVSGLSRYTRNYGKIDEKQAFANASVVQTDAAINLGNSGGPLLDLDGSVVGIISSKLSSGFDRSVSGIGFATSSDVIAVILPSLIEHGKFDYPYLGILSIGDLSLADLKSLGLAERLGVYVAEVIQGSPAEAAGLMSGNQVSRIPGVRSGGDLITEVGGIKITTFEELMAYIVLNKHPGEHINLSILRNSEELEIQLTLESRNY